MFPLDSRPEEIIRYKWAPTEEVTDRTTFDDKYWVPGAKFSYNKPWNHKPLFMGQTGNGQNKMTTSVSHMDWSSGLNNSPYCQNNAI